eukprot:SAG31_NODE_16454_length_708_cov_1.581281_1_plen_136_part_01
MAQHATARAVPLPAELTPLADDGAGTEERESAYAWLEASVVGGSSEEAAAGLAAEATKAPIVHVLCAPSRVGVPEFRRVGLLLGAMSEKQPFAVNGEMCRADSGSGAPLMFSVWDSPVFAELRVKTGGFSREDAIT